MKRSFLIFILIVSFGYGGLPGGRVGPNAVQSLEYKLWDGNQISNYHRNNGAVVDHNAKGKSGLEWPIGSGKTAVFASGLWLAAGRVNGVEEIRTAAAEYSREYAPGTYGSNQNDAVFHIYSIHAGDDASNPDWQNWPVDQGAPWVDVNGDGVYDPNKDRPDINGDLFHWYVMNDGDSLRHMAVFNTQPLGVEVRVSLFGEGPDSPLKDVMFVKWKIVNTGGNQLDSMFASFWSDPDIGDANNDFVGCDPESNLGFCYNDFNGDNFYGSVPPAVGYVFLQTPIMPSNGDTAWVSGDPIPDFTNIPMTAFSRITRHDFNPVTAEVAYSYMNGLVGYTDQSYIDPTTGQASSFIFNGDPVTGDGWVDYNYYPSGDRQFMLTAGPFSMAPGDTQEVAAAIVIAQGTDNISSITYLRQLAPWVQLAYDTDFKAIGPPLVFNNHNVPATTEDAVGPYHLEADIHANDGFVLDANSAFVHYGVDSIASVERLTAGGTNTYSSDIFGDGFTGTLKYYFYAEDTDGNGVYYPPGAPTGYLQFEVGPDHTLPVLENVTEMPNTIYTTGSEAVKITASDRYPLDVNLNYQINNGSIQNQVMNRIPETDRYETTLTWSDLTLGDQLAYWVVAIDSSNASNTAISDTNRFKITDSLAIGDWETWRYRSVYSYNLDQNQWPDSAHWYTPRHGRWVATNLLDVLGVDAGWAIMSPLTGVQPDTVISGSTFDITPFKEAGLAFRYACSVENITAHVEAASNDIQGTSYDILDSSILHGLDWILVDSLVSVGGPGVSGDFVEQEVSLFGFDTPVFIRISAEAPAATTPFIIDDIYLKVVHSLGTADDPKLIPHSFTLHQNYPNPFNPTTAIRYELPTQSDVRLTIYNIMGQEVSELVRGKQAAGEHEVIWNAGYLSSGVYFVQLVSGDFSQTQKVILMK